MKKKLARITTVPISMNIILRNQLKYMNQYYDVIGVTGYDNKHFHEIQNREGIRMKSINMSREISFFNDLTVLFKLIFFLIKEKPTIVHTQTPKAGFLGMLAAYLARVPVRFHTVGGMPLLGTSGFKRKILEVIEKITYACANKVYPNSQGLQEIILENKFCQPDKLKVIANGGSNGINIDFFNPIHEDLQNLRNEYREKHNIPSDAFVFVFVGRIAKEKGIQELLTAFQNIRNQNPHLNIKLLLIGPFESSYGILDDNIKQLIIEDKDILAPGRFDDVRPFYMMSDVYVFPSYREGFPNTLLEAGAMGLPIIATDINGCNEIVKDGLNGILITPKDIDTLQEAMLKMIKDEKLKHNLAENARSIIAKNYRNEIVWEFILNEYNQAVGKL